MKFFWIASYDFLISLCKFLQFEDIPSSVAGTTKNITYTVSRKGHDRAGKNAGTAVSNAGYSMLFKERYDSGSISFEFTMTAISR